MNTSKTAMENSMDHLSDQVMDDFRVVVADTEALLKATASQGGEKFADVRAKAEESLRVVKARMASTQDAVIAKTREAAKSTDIYVHEHPWKSVCAAAGIGVVVGVLIARR